MTSRFMTIVPVPIDPIIRLWQEFTDDPRPGKGMVSYPGLTAREVGQLKDEHAIAAVLSDARTGPA